MEGNEESLVWKLQAGEMRLTENRVGLRIFTTLAKSTTKFNNPCEISCEFFSRSPCFRILAQPIKITQENP